MSGHAVKKIDDMEGIYGGAFKRARAELGVESFGMQVIDMPANFDGYPEHDHSEDGQEEVYLALRGGGEIEIEGERYPLDGDHMARVGPGVSRKVWPGDDGIRLLVVGGTVGSVYEPPDVSVLGNPDPMAGQQLGSASGLIALAPVARLVAGAGGDRDRRVAGVGRVGPRAQAEREDRAAGVGHELLVPAAVAEPRRGPPRATAHRSSRKTSAYSSSRAAKSTSRPSAMPRPRERARRGSGTTARCGRRGPSPSAPGPARRPGSTSGAPARGRSRSRSLAKLALVAVDPHPDRPLENLETLVLGGVEMRGGRRASRAVGGLDLERLGRRGDDLERVVGAELQRLPHRAPMVGVPRKVRPGARRCRLGDG